MKIKISGNVGRQEILEIVSAALKELEDAGVEEYKAVNLYFTPYVSQEKVVPRIDGQEFDWTVPSLKSHITYSRDNKGEIVMSYQKGLNADLILDNKITVDEHIELVTQKAHDRQETERAHNKSMLNQFTNEYRARD